MVRFNLLTVNILTGIFLAGTLLSSCSILPFSRWGQVDDPVAKAAMKYREWSSLHPSNPLSQPYPKMTKEHQEAIQEGIKRGALVEGMKKTDVIQTWGKPHRSLIAGDPSEENEKWIYMDRPPFQGKFSSAKTVTFERGHVVGWETEAQ